jgi:hypothetical protein
MANGAAFPEAGGKSTPRGEPEFSADTAHGIISKMGINVPKIHGCQGISDALEWDIPKLTPNQISHFVAEAYKHARQQ